MTSRSRGGVVSALLSTSAVDSVKREGDRGGARGNDNLVPLGRGSREARDVADLRTETLGSRRGVEGVHRAAYVDRPHRAARDDGGPDALADRAPRDDEAVCF